MKFFSRTGTKLAATLTLSVGLGLVSFTVHALPFLVGASLYQVNQSGGAQNLGFRYSTNLNDGAAAFPLDQVGDNPDVGAINKGISFELGLGANVFEFDRTFGVTRPFYGLQVFFNETGTSFNPAQTTPAIIGDLVVAVVADSTTDEFTPAAGTLVPTYGRNVNPVSTAAYNGASVFSIGNFDLEITSLDVTHRFSPNFFSGSFEITVSSASPAPAPPSLVLAGLGLALVVVRVRKHGARA